MSGSPRLEDKTQEISLPSDFEEKHDMPEVLVEVISFEEVDIELDGSGVEEPEESIEEQEAPARSIPPEVPKKPSLRPVAKHDETVESKESLSQASTSAVESDADESRASKVQDDQHNQDLYVSIRPPSDFFDEDLLVDSLDTEVEYTTDADSGFHIKDLAKRESESKSDTGHDDQHKKASNQDATSAASADNEQSNKEGPSLGTVAVSWYRKFFDTLYPKTVRALTHAEVVRRTKFIEEMIQLKPGSSILDAGCGVGLVSVELATKGYNTVGVDLSAALLSRAVVEAEDRGVDVKFIHGDIRRIDVDGVFDAILCMDTTFGYFGDDINGMVLERFFRALKPMGLLLLEVVNRDYVLHCLPHQRWFEGEDCVCMENAHFDFITSRLEVTRSIVSGGEDQQEQKYSIRLYSLHELGRMLHQQGFRVLQVGGRQSAPDVFFGAHSPNIIVLAERPKDTMSDDCTDFDEDEQSSSFRPDTRKSQSGELQSPD